MKSSHSKSITGIAIIIIGLLLLLKTTGILTFSFVGSFGTYWPLGLILIGLALIFRAKILALIIFIAFLGLGSLYLFDAVKENVIDNVVFDDTRLNTYVDDVPFDPDIKTLYLQVDHGAGEVNILGGSSSLLTLDAISVFEPKFRYDKKSDQMDVHIEKDWGGVVLGKTREKYTIRLNDQVPVRMNLGYGFGKTNIDLRGLKVEDIDIDEGASDTAIVFGRYPTKVQIDSGASTYRLKFPEGSGVMIKIDAGATTVNLDGFSRNDRVYYSEGYDPNGDNIELEINAGAATIEGEFY